MGVGKIVHWVVPSGCGESCSLVGRLLPATDLGCLLGLYHRREVRIQLTHECIPGSFLIDDLNIPYEIVASRLVQFS